MSLTPGDALEAALTIALSVVSSAAVVKRVLSGPVGKRLAELVTQALGQLVGALLEAERPKMLEALEGKVRAMVREAVREETESLRERLARVEGVLEGAGLIPRGSEAGGPAKGVSRE